MDLYSFIKVAIYTVFLLKVDGRVTDEEYELMPRLFHLDDFDHCLSLGEKGLFCTVIVQLAPINPANSSNVWKIIQDVSSNPKNYRHDRIRHGVCVPEFCSQTKDNITFYKNNHHLLKEELSQCYSKKYEHLELKNVITDMHCETREPFYAIDMYDISVGLFILAWLGLVVIGSYYEGRARYKTKEEYQKITNTAMGKLLSCFSVIKNWKQLINTKINPDTAALRCINGIRFYNMVLVIMAHTSVAICAVAFSNPLFFERLTEYPLSIMLFNGTFIIQTFFVIAGWLLSYNFFLTFEKHKTVQYGTIIKAIVNRYIRLVPCLMTMIALHSTWLYHVGRGPYWDRTMGVEYRNCRANWWTNLLFINNYYDPEHMCLQQTWYLAADTQAFLLSIVMIILMWMYQKHIKTILIIGLISTISIPGIVNYIQDYDIVVRFYPEALYNSLLLGIPQWHVMYSSGYSNFGSYVIGLTYGYIYYKFRNEKVFTKKTYIALWWIVVWGTAFGIIFVGIPIYSDDYQNSRIWAAIYVSASRNLFGFAFGFLIFGITQGIGWIVRYATIWPLARVMGKLTYCAYLIHPALIRIKTGMSRAPNYLSTYILGIETLENMTISYILAIMLCLCVELPIAELQKFASPPRKEKEEQPKEIKISVINGSNVTNSAQMSKM